MYVSAQVFISIILAIGPLVFMFLFFERTKKTFDNWLDILISFSLQQIFIVLTLSFFNSLIYIVIKHVFAYTVCWNSILSLTLFGSPLSLLSFWKIPSGSTSGSALNLQAAAENGPGFYNIMLFYIIGTLMGKFISSMADMAQEFSGGVKISGFSGNLTNKIKAAGDYAKNITKTSLTKPLDVVKGKIDGFNERAGKSYDEKYKERKNSMSDANKNKAQLEFGQTTTEEPNNDSSDN